MKRDIEKRIFITSGMGNGGEAQILATAEIFDILSRKLYSNPIRAIIRELSTNAFDSHTENGNPQQPFKIKLPNKIDPIFYIEDFGTGMSQEKMVNLYKNYFASSRTESNNFVGQLGLGSKSPMAYTDTVIITSRWKGIETHYIYAKNEKGIPTLKIQESRETTEPSGIKILFTIDPKDFAFFAQEAIEILQYFDPIPEIVGDSKVLPGIENRKRKDISISGSFWELIREYGSDEVVMGNIAYPITESREIKEIKAEMGSHGVRFRFYIPIGSVSITPSREDLHYNEKTIKTLIESYREIKDELQLRLKEELRVKNLCQISEFLGENNNYGNFIDKFKFTFPESVLLTNGSGSVIRDIIPFDVRLSSMEKFGYSLSYKSRYILNAWTTILNLREYKEHIIIQTKESVSRLRPIVKNCPDIHKILIIKPPVSENTQDILQWCKKHLTPKVLLQEDAEEQWLPKKVKVKVEKKERRRLKYPCGNYLVGSITTRFIKNSQELFTNQLEEEINLKEGGIYAHFLKGRKKISSGKITIEIGSIREILYQIEVALLLPYQSIKLFIYHEEKKEKFDKLFKGRKNWVTLEEKIEEAKKIAVKRYLQTKEEETKLTLAQIATLYDILNLFTGKDFQDVKNLQLLTEMITKETPRTEESSDLELDQLSRLFTVEEKKEISKKKNQEFKKLSTRIKEVLEIISSKFYLLEVLTNSFTQTFERGSTNNHFFLEDALKAEVEIYLEAKLQEEKHRLAEEIPH